ARIERVEWRSIDASLDAQGFAQIPPLLTADECRQLAALYKDDARFRSRIQMERFRFGAGEYKYFAAPLPPIVQTLRTEFYAHLAPIANRWSVRLTATKGRVPETLDAFLATCHKPGQRRP